MSKLQKHLKGSFLNAVRVKYDKVITDLNQNPKLLNNLKVGGMGLLLGIVLGSLLVQVQVQQKSSSLDGIDLLSTTKSSSSVPWDTLKGSGWNPIHVFLW
jgi:hypothetical protein